MHREPIGFELQGGQLHTGHQAGKSNDLSYLIQLHLIRWEMRLISGSFDVGSKLSYAALR